MQVYLYKLRDHIVENKDILSDNSILFQSSHRESQYLFKSRNILFQLIFLFVYFSKLSMRLFFLKSNILWLNQTSNSNYIVYHLNYKYSYFANILSDLKILNIPKLFNSKFPKSTYKQLFIHKFVRFFQFIFTFFWIVKSLFQRRKRFKYCNYYDIIHCFQSLQTLIYFEWSLRNNTNYTLLALNSDSVTSAIHHYSNIRVISVYCEFLNNNAQEFYNYNVSEKVISFNNLFYVNPIKIGAIPPKLLKYSSSQKFNLYILDTCDVNDALYNEHRRKTLQELYSNSDLLNYNCNHIFHPGISKNEYAQTLKILPNAINIFHGLSEISDIPKNSLVIGFHSTSLLAFAFLKCKVFTFPNLDSLYFDNYFQNIPFDLSNFKVHSLIDYNIDPNAVFESLNFFDFKEFIQYLGDYSHNEFVLP
jgi:hypothetical protein